MCWVISVKCRHVTSNDNYYASGDYCGDLGVEKSYEEHHRGTKEWKYSIRDAYGRIQGKFEDGAHDVAPVSGRLNIEPRHQTAEIRRGTYGQQNRGHSCNRAVDRGDTCHGEQSHLRPQDTCRPRARKKYGILKDDFYKPLFDRV